MRNAGLRPPDVIEFGRITRFPGQGKSPSNRAGWCYLSEDGSQGAFGDWSTGLRQVWTMHKAGQVNKCFAVGKPRRRVDAQNRQDAIHRRAALRALEIWTGSIPAPSDHPYVSAKLIAPLGAKLYKNCIALAIRTFQGSIASIQFIDPDGNKRLLRDGRKKGAFIHVSGGMRQPALLVICEGWATGCTLATTINSATVLAAVDAWNLLGVAEGARRLWPSVEIVVAADDDRLTVGNPGLTAARRAAAAVRGAIIQPDWPADAPRTLTDFNDLACWTRGAA